MIVYKKYILPFFVIISLILINDLHSQGQQKIIQLSGVVVGQDSVQTFAELIDVKTGKVTRHDRTHSL